MTATDSEQLIDMGFTAELVKKALLKTSNSGIQSALDWIEAHPNALDATSEEEEQEEEIVTETANSLKCDTCGRLLKDSTAAQAHAEKTDHVGFSESTLAIKPLTAEEKATKMAELQERMIKRKAERAKLAIEEIKAREKIRRTSGVEMQVIREKLERDAMTKEVEDRKREKEADRVARDLIRKQLELDKQERVQQALERKGLAKAAPLVAPVLSTAKYDETRIQIRLESGLLTNTFKATDKLAVVYAYVQLNQEKSDFKLMQTYPRRVLDAGLLDSTLKELNLVPSASLIIQ